MIGVIGGLIGGLIGEVPGTVLEQLRPTDFQVFGVVLVLGVGTGIATGSLVRLARVPTTTARLMAISALPGLLLGGAWTLMNWLGV